MRFRDVFCTDFIFSWSNQDSFCWCFYTQLVTLLLGFIWPPGKSLDVLGKCLFLLDLTWNFNLGKPAATCCHGDSFELLVLQWVMNSSMYFYLFFNSRQQQSKGKNMFIVRQCHLWPDYCQCLSCFPLSGEGGSQKGQTHHPSWSFL